MSYSIVASIKIFGSSGFMPTFARFLFVSSRAFFSFFNSFFTVLLFNLACSVSSYFTFITSKVSCSVEIEKNESDAIKFTKEYSLVSINNVFVYRNIDEIINILNNGTGIIYLGFPDCKWCQAYVPMLNQVAIENNLSKIYYFNIYEDRKNNSTKYKEIVDLLQDYLQYDDEGNKRIYVPAIIAVKNGEIVGFDDETSYDTKGYDDPSVYWKEEGTDALLDKLSDMISKVNNFVCTDCNK